LCLSNSETCSFYLFTVIFSSHPQPGGNHLVGLALVQNARFYERVGLFQISVAKLEELPQGWRVLCKRQTVRIV